MYRDKRSVDGQLDRRARAAAQRLRSRSLTGGDLDISRASHHGKQLARLAFRERKSQASDGLKPHSHGERVRPDGGKLIHVKVRSQVSETIGLEDRTGPSVLARMGRFIEGRANIVFNTLSKLRGRHSGCQVRSDWGRD